MRALVQACAMSLAQLYGYGRHPLLAVRFRRALGYWPNIAAPSSYNEKLLWRKVFDRNPLFTELSDRLKAQDYLVSRSSGALSSAPRLWVGLDGAAIPDAALAPGTVLKATHGSGWNEFIEAEPVDRPAIRNRASQWLARRYGAATGEWGYRGVQPRLVVERLLHGSAGQPLLELKLHAMNGRLAMCFAMTHPKRKGARYAIFDRDGRRLKARAAVVYNRDEHVLPADFRLPREFAAARKSIEQASRGIDYARFDVLVAEGGLHAGEVTLYCNAGLAAYDDPAIDKLLSGCWSLADSWFVGQVQQGWRELYRQALAARLG